MVGPTVDDAAGGLSHKSAVSGWAQLLFVYAGAWTFFGCGQAELLLLRDTSGAPVDADRAVSLLDMHLFQKFGAEHERERKMTTATQSKQDRISYSEIGLIDCMMSARRGNAVHAIE